MTITSLVDTDWVVYYLNGRQDIVERLDVLKHQGLGLSTVALGELYEGVYYSRDPEEDGAQHDVRGDRHNWPHGGYNSRPATTSAGQASWVCLHTLPMMQGTTPHREKGQNMAEPQETRQEQETRWAAQRATRDKAFQAGRHARYRENKRTWLIVAVIGLILAVIVAVVLL